MSLYDWHHYGILEDIKDACEKVGIKGLDESCIQECLIGIDCATGLEMGDTCKGWCIYCGKEGVFIMGDMSHDNYGSCTG